MDEQGIGAARAFFAEALPLRDERYLIGENSFNNLGYRLLGEGRNEEAVAVFEMNAEAFPDSWNVHDSLGDRQPVAPPRLGALLDLDTAHAARGQPIDHVIG